MENLENNGYLMGGAEPTTLVFDIGEGSALPIIFMCLCDVSWIDGGNGWKVLFDGVVKGMGKSYISKNV